MKGNKKKFIIAGVVNFILFALMITIIVLGNFFSPILEVFLPSIGGNKYDGWAKSEFSGADEMNAERRKVGKQIEAEGAVLLKNEVTLPLSENAKVSVFGQHAHEMLSSGSGSGSIGETQMNLKESLEKVGFSVNDTLWNFYINNGVKSLGHGPALAGAHTTTDWSINECPREKYSDTVKNSYKQFHDAAIVVISRTGGEGGDLPRNMSEYGGSQDQNYLELNADEKNLLADVTKEFDKVVVLLNTNNPFEMGFLNDYDIGACLYIGGVGMSGMEAIGALLSGDENPSGRLVDTYVYDNFSSPASQNFGDYKYSNSNYNYVVYSEGIYVGYRYYETRYYDKVTEAANVGNYDYDSVVAYPFGYGLSYTNFKYSDFKYEYDAEKDELVFSVEVANVGDKAGKEVVELYLNAPYEHGVTQVEKSAVKLVAFEKTELLEANTGKETVTLRVPKKELVSYDAKTAKTYVLEAGEYNFTVAANAHAAVNNILKAKGYDVTGEAEAVKSYTVDTSDSVTYSKDAVTKTEITNLFDYAQFDGMKVISRSDWTQVDKGIEYSNLAISDADLAQAQLTGKQASRNPDWNKEVGDVKTNSGGTLKLADFTETPYEDKKWDELVAQIKRGDLQKMFAMSGYATMAIDEVGKPRAKDSDGPGGISSFVGGASNVDAYGYPTETVLACTWNKELAQRMGEMVGEDGLIGGISGWYAPAMDTHRTPFGGRNFEYYSEDGHIGGKMGAAVVKGAQSKGLYCYIKHFALNEQDTNRGGNLHTWANEQAMREVYFEPFRISVQEGDALGVMTSLNCIGVTYNVGNYNLITKLLKEEWGFKGMVITDYIAPPNELIEQCLYSGGDIILSTYGNYSTTNNADKAQLQRAAKSVLYTVSRSNAMYLVSSDGSVNAGFPLWILLVIIISVVLGAAIVTTDLFLFLPRKKKENTEEQSNN